MSEALGWLNEKYLFQIHYPGLLLHIWSNPDSVPNQSYQRLVLLKLRCIERIRASFLPSTREATAQIAAGSQPINVHCSIRHNIPEKIFPLRKKKKARATIRLLKS